MADGLTEFEASDLARILWDIKRSVLDKDWKRLEAKADDLKRWCVWLRERKQVEKRG
ncbi:hypothetical protein ES705_26502 [subsurface metagenome]